MYQTMRPTLKGWIDDLVPAAAAFAAEHEAALREHTIEGRFPAEIFAEMGKLGWVGVLAPPEVGGLGGGVAEYCALQEEVGRWALVSPQTSMQAQRWLIDWGTPEQRERYLGPIARGELIFSEAISEPGMGSSMKTMRATARRDGSDWILSGTKVHVNLGKESGLTLFYGMAPEGLTAFLVDNSPELIESVHTRPIGLRLLPTAEMRFDEVRVPGSAVLGEVGRGMDTFLTTFNVSRLGNASELLGIGRRALAQAVRYGQERQVGTGKVVDFQGIQWTIADLYADLVSAAMVRNHAAEVADRGDDPAFETSLAKQVAIRASEHAVNEAFALTGGHGLYDDTDYGQLLHDVKVLRVAGGSLEILRNYVARTILRSETLRGL
ncbi:acyl-CoA dehydrogenase family protein [Streptomyces sp. NPDC051985]|uniref:acyl-CoA dehydrogenase family protein n=1 Tax=Streptomyces sp. NPDC051985 TaxID=3155807 RepID=UPI00342A850B